MAIVNQDAVNQNKPPLIAIMYKYWIFDYIIELVQRTPLYRRAKIN